MKISDIKTQVPCPMCGRLEAALQAIRDKPEGIYSRDRITYLKNVIAWCQETARKALEEIADAVSSV